MTSAKKALVIASTYKGLQGTLNDASRIHKVLEKYEFEVKTCLGPHATRAGIYEAWQQLIATTGSNDTIVIYYSGHGGMVESALEKDRTGKDWRYQFLVPLDFENSSEDDFRGILDVEISHLLRKITDRTSNVTILLDCCHSGRIARAPEYGDRAAPRRIAPVAYDDVAAFRDLHLQRVFAEDQNDWGTGSFREENPNVVRVVAAAASETAWEYHGADGLWRGAFTEALARILEDTHGKNIPWKTSLLRLQELVHSRFPTQHPQVEGPEARIPFLMQRVESKAIHLKMEDEMPVLQAGRMSCVHEGSIYGVLSLGSEEASTTKEIAECEVEAASLFQALGRLRYSSEIHSLPPEGALAFLKQSALCKWPIKTSPETLVVIGDALSGSSFLRNSDPTEYREVILEITFENSFLAVRSAHGHRVAMRYLNPEDVSQSTDVCKAIIFDADRLARAQHFLTLRSEHHQEQLAHSVAIQVGLVENRYLGKMLLGNGTDRVRTGDRIYLELSNEGTETVYINILYVNVQGKISLISRSSPLGIELPSGRSHWVGKNRFDILEGLKVSWPSDMSQALPVNETLVIMLTQSPLDMRPLETPDRPPPAFRGSSTALDSMMLQLSHGHRRNVTLDQERQSNAFEMIHFPLTVEPEEQASRSYSFQEIDKHNNNTAVSVNDLPLPEMLTEEYELRKLPPQLAPKHRVSITLPQLKVPK